MLRASHAALLRGTPDWRLGCATRRPSQERVGEDGTSAYGSTERFVVQPLDLLYLTVDVEVALDVLKGLNTEPFPQIAVCQHRRELAGNTVDVSLVGE